MLIQGSSVSNRTELLIKKYTQLLESGVDASKILVLVQNSFKKNLFTESVKNSLKINHFEEPQIHTFYGLAYNAVLNNWAKIENSIPYGSPTITPNLTGLEISQFFFKNAIKEAGFKDYNSKINLIHQLFRRHSLITNNNLTDNEVQERVKILNETFAPDAKTAIDIFKKNTIEYRAFDYIRQLNIFNFVYKNTGYFKNIEYIVVDDADEITNAEFDFLKHLKPQLNEIFVGYDKFGSSRLGFLNTDTQIVKNIETHFEGEITNCDNLPEPKKISRSFSYSRRLEMIENAMKEIAALLDNGVSPEEISIVTPTCDSALKFAFCEFFDNKNIKYQFFSGSEKLVQTPCIKNTLTLINLANKELTDVFEFRSLIYETLKIPIKYCLKIIENYKQTGEILYFDLRIEEYNERLQQLVETIEEISSKELLSEKVFLIYKKLLENELTQKDTASFSFLLKQVLDFEKVFKTEAKNPRTQKEIIVQLENSIISENPSSAPEIKKEHITISTAQKIIDFSLKTKYQFWLDTTSNEWTKEDLGTLYNSWVYQKSWDKNTFTYDDNLVLSKEKTLRGIRKLSLLADEIYDYSSLFDIQGNENFGGIKQYFGENENKTTQKINFQFTPRDDQKAVLDYNSGSMAISAVPGAGKTTILLALIMKLLKQKVQSENIFVLTYMESAARNFKERIKKACPTLEKLPNISTIHGLSLRILKENSNFVKAGLDENFEVCDDNQRQKIIRELMYKMQIESDDFDKYEKAISTLKLSDIQKMPFVSDNELKKFLKFYYAYNFYLKDRNTIDYDDMLVLSVKILEENKDIATYYQNICRYVIEDEAQDSSVVQQKLLNILSKKYKNIIRCGDVNQAITTTFTNADVEGFRRFIKNSANVEMNKSQRCAKGIYELANKLVEFSYQNDTYKNAFYNIKMNAVEGKNPYSENPVKTAVFDTFQQEREYLLQNIRNIFKKDADATVAILVRSNFQITEYSAFLSDYGYEVITRSDYLKEQPIFSLFFDILKFCEHPWQNEYLLNTAQTLHSQKHLKFSEKDFEFIKNLETPFILEETDAMPTKALAQFSWDMNYWLGASSLSVDELALKIGNYYYISEIEKSNVQMISLLLKKLTSLYKNHTTIIEQLEVLANRPIMNQCRFFNEEETPSCEKNNSGKIRIMTYHKSKGDEFDYVFIPELSEDVLTLDPIKVKIKSKERFLEAIKALNYNYKKKDEKELKLFQIEENLRLLYVAVTRAKKELFITCAKKYKKFSRLKDTKTSLIFESLLDTFGGEN